VWRQSEAEIKAGIARGIGELAASGTTHVGDITNTWLSVEPLLASQLRGVVYLEVLGHHRGRVLKRLGQAKRAICQARRHPNYGLLQVGLSIHAPYSCHPELLRAGAEWCRTEKVPLCIHVAESPAETELLLTGKLASIPWPVQLLAKLFGALPGSTPGLRPIPYLERLGVLAARPLLVHAVQVTDKEIARIGDAGCAVVHCPRSNRLLSCGRMALERFLAANVPVYLGTDSRASSPDLDVRAEAAFAQQVHREYVEPDQLLPLLHQPLPG
jgi:cytosine/adenosine deaminase-related metal-dependent hydrolase